YEKHLWSELGHGEPITVIAARDDGHEAERVASEIMHHRFQNRTRHADYAVLYRGNYQARILEQRLRELGIPYRVSGGRSFFDL
ncbi:MAG: ATP-dependent DNA helicase Rep, partial [Actinobacteria bacterium]|nr:ATP-dependent DNA helicase Rep [Actinomycetota bacterium]NIS30197.1 ATP-dependent DNA helicase Rep [Actinomycetota bacterium]NIU66919.1 ATP-dependent DNA helicase Rep [Actinomycetota bacterium]NIW27254.1 ATP-dependent DNA helicase Rep [Actinomycetota bacterium]NIX19786.1 ATP-dependent DNA helicase Rep [Actinomycetota bacterium]